MTPRVTVLMSVFNGKDLLPRAIAGILSQTFTDFEFLIIDDGSTEPVLDIIHGYSDSRIVVHSQENKGLPRSLNRGLALAKGRYVARMDADDISHPRRLERQVAVLESDKRIDLVGCFFEVANAAGAVIETKELITDPIYRLWRLLFHNNYGHGTMVLRKQAVLDAGGYDVKLRFAQDYDLWSRLSTKDNNAMVPEVLYQYRLDEGSSQSSVKNYETQFENAVRISNRNLQSCCPTLTEPLCEEVRALYWKFRIPAFTPIGLRALPELLVRFSERHILNSVEYFSLARRVSVDIREETKHWDALYRDEVESILSRFVPVG
jgi:glycosyltransferase involved in cell wall biosynthesis